MLAVRRRRLASRRRSSTSTRYGSGHSEAIVTGSTAAARAFQLGVDAACVYVNASTRFTDGGEFGMGAEIGNSTQKLHARGPIGLRELCTFKYLVEGTGQVRAVARRVRVGLLGGTFNPPHLGASGLRAGGARRSSGSTASCSCPCASRRTRRSRPTRASSTGWRCARRRSRATALRRVARGRRSARAVLHGRHPARAACARRRRATVHRRRGHGDVAARRGASRRSCSRWPRSAVAEREGVRRDDIVERLAAAAGRGERVRFFDDAAARHLVLADAPPRRRGLPMRYLVPDAVAAYIDAHGGCTAGRRPLAAAHDGTTTLTSAADRQLDPRPASPSVDRRLRVRQEGDRHRRARPARRARLHGLLRRSARATPTARPRRSTTASTRGSRRSTACCRAASRAWPRRAGS